MIKSAAQQRIEYIYHPLVENSRFDSARQRQIEALRSERGFKKKGLEAMSFFNFYFSDKSHNK